MKKTLTASFLILTQLVWGQNIKENAFAKLGLQKPFVVIGLDTKDRIEVTSVTGALLRQLKKFDNYQERVAIVAPNNSIASYLAEHDSIYHDLKTVFDAKLAVVLAQNKPNSSITLVGGEKVRQWQLSKMNDDTITSVISAMRAAGAPSAHAPVFIADAALAKRSVVSFDGQKAVIFDERNQKALIYDFANARHTYDFVKIDEQNFREVSLRLADGYELATPAETKRSLNSSSGKPPFNVSCYSAVQNASVAHLVQVFRKEEPEQLVISTAYTEVLALKQNKASTLQFTARDNYYLLRGIQLNNRLYEAQANCGFAVVDNKLYMAYLDHSRKQGNLHEYRYVLGIRELANDGKLKDVKTVDICSYVDTAATIAPMVDKKGNVFLPDTKKKTVLLNGVQIPFANLYNSTDGIAQFLDLSIHDSKLYFAASTTTDKTVVGCYDLKSKKSKAQSITNYPYSAASIFQTTVVLFYKDKPNNKIALERIEL